MGHTGWHRLPSAELGFHHIAGLCAEPGSWLPGAGGAQACGPQFQCCSQHPAGGVWAAWPWGAVCTFGSREVSGVRAWQPQLLRPPPRSDLLLAPQGWRLFASCFPVAAASRRTAESWPAGDRRGSSGSGLAHWRGGADPAEGLVSAGPAREAALRLSNSADLFVSRLLPKWQKIKAPSSK